MAKPLQKRVCMRNALGALLILALVLFFVPGSASAATVEEIIALTNAGVSEAVLLALVERDQSVFALAPPQIVALKQAGVSEAVVLAMLRSGRQRLPESAPTVPPSSAERTGMLLNWSSSVTVPTYPTPCTRTDTAISEPTPYSSRTRPSCSRRSERDVSQPAAHPMRTPGSGFPLPWDVRSRTNLPWS